MRGQKSGFRHSQATKDQISKTTKGRLPLAIHIKRDCPTCGISMSVGNLGRHVPVCKAKAERGHFPEMTVFEVKQLRRKLRPYGLTTEDYVEIMNKQGYVCAICGGTTGFGARSLAVDHCHRTENVRGFLCDFCNKILGLARDRPEVLERAAQYLDETNLNDFDIDGCDSTTPKEWGDRRESNPRIPSHSRTLYH